MLNAIDRLLMTAKSGSVQALLPGIIQEVREAIAIDPPDMADLRSTAKALEAGIAASPDKAESTALGELHLEVLSKLIGDAPAHIPVSLLPVRLETRFVEDGAGGHNLRIRVYPDSISVDTHEPSLTDAERDGGLRYHSAVAASGSEDDRLAAWAELAGRFSDRRAAWIVRVSAPDQPPIASRPGKWTPPAHVTTLPDYWVALGYRGPDRVFAKVVEATIPNPLHVGPSLQQPTATTDNSKPPLDDKAIWLVDYPAAEKAGMALEVELGASAQQGLSRLVVLGVRSGLDAEAAADQLADLIRAHQFTDGAALIAPGTPTNNTPEAPAGYSSDYTDLRDGHRKSYQLLSQPRCQQGDHSDGSRLAAALGIEAATFTSVPDADSTHSLDAQAMNALLWHATWGQFLTEKLAATPSSPGTPVAPDMVDALRQHFIDWVRPQGPLATFRVGREPYGVLPVLPLEKNSGPDDPAHLAGLADVVAKLLPLWEDAGSQTDGTTKSIADLLSRTAVPQTATARAAFAKNNNWYQHALACTGLTRTQMDAWMDTELPGKVAKARQLLGRDVPWPTEVLVPPLPQPDPLAWVAAGPAGLPWVQIEPQSTSKPLVDNYLQRLATADRDAVQAESGRPANDSLLYLVARYALLRAAAEADRPGAKATFPTPRPTFAARGDMDAAPSATAPTALDQVLAAIAHLAGRPSAVLQRLTTETLDLASSRLDAWITSLASRRLAALRAEPADGVVLGAYGVVENLPAPRGDVPVQTPPPGEEGPLVHDPSNTGYLAAPSLPQAVTAAVLRSGYVNHHESAPEGAPTSHGLGPLAVDLSSRRVRLAEFLLDGMRQGQPLGVLLGYRLERDLHQFHVEDYIAPLRHLAPLSVPAGSSDAASVAAATDVVDGFALARLRHSPMGIPWGQAIGGHVLGPEVPAVTAALNVLDDALDAVSDALVAEAVHQTVQGNTARAQAAVAAASSGLGTPPELEFPRTARTGRTVKHRLILPLAPSPSPTDGWASTPRQRAEPALAAWAVELLGDAGRYHAKVHFADPSTGEEVAVLETTLADLSLSALDVICLADLPGEIERYVEHLLLTDDSQQNKVPKGAVMTLDVRPPVADEQLTFADALTVARTGAELFTVGRALDARDLDLPGLSEARLDSPDPFARFTETWSRLSEVQAGIEESTDSAGQVTDEPSLRNAMKTAWFAGIPGALPTRADTDPGVLARHAGAVLGTVHRRCAEAALLQGKSADEAVDPAVRLEQLEILFGAPFRAVAAFTLPIPDLPKAAINGTTADSEDGSQDAHAWFARMALVRPAVATIARSVEYSEALGTKQGLRLRIGQLPTNSGEPQRWAGLPEQDARPIPANTVSLAFIAGTTGEHPTAPFAGLLVDSWDELVPAEKETAAVAFHYDAPGAQAPHVVLVVVPPPGHGANWQLADLEAAVTDTLTLARVRAADPGDIEQLRAFLPAIHIPSDGVGGIPPDRLLIHPPADLAVVQTAAAPAVHWRGASPNVRQGASVTVDVTGTNLGNATYTVVGGGVTLSVSQKTDSSAHLVLAAGPDTVTGAHLLVASSPIGGTSTPATFNVLPRPRLSSLNPSSVAQAVGTNSSSYLITLSGVALEGVTSVSISGSNNVRAALEPPAPTKEAVVVRVKVMDLPEWKSNWDPTEPGHPTKPPKPPPLLHKVVPLTFTLAASDGTTLNSASSGLSFTLDGLYYKNED